MRFSLRSLLLFILVFGGVIALAVRNERQAQKIIELETQLNGISRMIQSSIEVNGTPFSNMSHCVLIGTGAPSPKLVPFVVIGHEKIEYKVLRFGQVDLLQLQKDVEQLKQKE